MDKKYYYYGGAGLVLIGVIYVYRKKKTEAAQRELAQRQSDANTAMTYQSGIASGSGSGISYSAPMASGGVGGGGGSTNPAASGAQSMLDTMKMYALGSGAASGTGSDNSVTLAKIMADMQTGIAKITARSNLDLQTQGTQNAGIFEYAMKNLQYGGSVDVKFNDLGTQLNISNPNNWSDRQFWNDVNSKVILAKSENETKLVDAQIAKQNESANQQKSYIESLYASLGRSNPDAAGMAYWTAQAKNKDLDELTRGFYGGAVANPNSAAEAEKAKDFLKGLT